MSHDAPTSSDRLGALVQTDDGRYALRFERRLPRPATRAWQALTDPDRLAAWFPAVVAWDLRPGAELRFDPTPEQRRRYGLTDQDATFGRITEVDPPHLLEHTWGAETLRWELHDDDAGTCLLVFTNTFDDRGTAAPAGAGWHAGLEVLEAQVDDRPVDWSPFDRAEALSARYETLAD